MAVVYKKADDIGKLFDLEKFGKRKILKILNKKTLLKNTVKN